MLVVCPTCASPVLVDTGCPRAHVHETHCTAREGLAAVGTACDLWREGGEERRGGREERTGGREERTGGRGERRGQEGEGGGGVARVGRGERRGQEGEGGGEGERE